MWQKYEVSWRAMGLTFNYKGTELVDARSTEEAMRFALREAENRMCLAKSLMNITSVRIIVQ